MSGRFQIACWPLEALASMAALSLLVAGAAQLDGAGKLTVGDPQSSFGGFRKAY
jgi:hypothetical protein